MIIYIYNTNPFWDQTPNIYGGDEWPEPKDENTRIIMGLFPSVNQ